MTKAKRYAEDLRLWVVEMETTKQAKPRELVTEFIVEISDEFGRHKFEKRTLSVTSKGDCNIGGIEFSHACIPHVVDWLKENFID